jgi:mono/diheme cytochrome c family protein
VGALPVAVRKTADAEMRAMVAMMDRLLPPDSVAARAGALIKRITTATGAALDPYPAQPPSLGRGAAVFNEQCIQCHGATGRGDGPKARHLEGPPPADLADRTSMADVSPVDAYRKVTIGVAGTAMPEFEESLSPEDRWAVATYVATLRTDEGTVRAGATLYAAKCATCHGATGGGDGPFASSISVRLPALRDLAVQGPLTDRDLEQLVLHRPSSGCFRPPSIRARRDRLRRRRSPPCAVRSIPRSRFAPIR